MYPLAVTFGQQLLVALSSVVVAAILAWIVGSLVAYLWDERRRRREGDLAALAAFYRTYGEFFATWKLWDSHKEHAETVESPADVQWQLLQRAEVAEGGFEALLVKLASERELGTDDRVLLGCFREGYQMLRESIRADTALAWWSSPVRADDGFAQYRAFKALVEHVAFRLEQPPRRHFLIPRTPSPSRRSAIEALLEITRRESYNERWWTIAAEVLQLPPSDRRASA